MSKTQTLTLTDFLLARIAEDEAEARSYLADLNEHPPSVYDMVQVGWIDAGSPERVLAECEAKRRIVERYVARERDARSEVDYAVADALRGVLIALAEPDAEHPDWREEWRA